MRIEACLKMYLLSHITIYLNRCKQVYWNILRIILLQSEKKSDYVLKFCRNVQYLISWELFPFYWKEYYRRRKATLTNKTPLNVKLRQITDWWVVTRKRPVNAVIKSPGKLFHLSIKMGDILMFCPTSLLLFAHLIQFNGPFCDMILLHFYRKLYRLWVHTYIGYNTELLRRLCLHYIVCLKLYKRESRRPGRVTTRVFFLLYQSKKLYSLASSFFCLTKKILGI